MPSHSPRTRYPEFQTPGFPGAGRSRGRGLHLVPELAEDARQDAGDLHLAHADTPADLGLGQINSANLSRLGLSIEAAFDPCRNLTAAAQILSEGYAKARPRHADDQAALRAALSLYNTGDETRGLRNGYVAKVLGPAPSVPVRPATEASAVRPWDVFGHAQAADAFFITVSAPAASEVGELP